METLLWYFGGFSLLWFGSVIATGILASYKRASVVGFVFLALFLGPIALLIVLLLPSAARTAAQGSYSSDDARRELSLIKYSFSALQARIHALEEKLSLRPQPQAPLPEATAPLPQVPAPRVQALASESARAEGEGFEFVFGKYWLSRIGIVLCFLGLSFFIGYTFKYLNALAKILIGYCAAGAFFAWGHFLLKRKQYVKVATAILGGAWGFLYLVTYAMHYIEVTRIISNPIHELWLLVLVSFAAIFYNLKYRSWVVTSLTFLLAFVTAGLGGIDYSSVFYCILLSGCIVYFSARLQWHKFLLFTMLGIYITYMWWIHPHIFTTFLVTARFTIPVYQFQLAFGVLLGTWLFFSFGLFFMNTNTAEKLLYVTRALLANAGLFTMLGLSELYRVQPFLEVRWDIRYWFLLLLAGIYFIFALLFRLAARTRLLVACCCSAFILTTMAGFIKFQSLSVSIFWLLLMAVLMALGVYYQERWYRFLARVLTVMVMARLFIIDYHSPRLYLLFGNGSKHAVVIFLFTAAIFYLLGYYLKTARISRRLLPQEDSFCRGYYSVFAAVLFVFIPFSRHTMSFFWSLQVFGLFLAATFSRERIYRVIAAVACLFLTTRLFAVDFFMDRTYVLGGFRLEHNVLLFVWTALGFFGLRWLIKARKNLNRVSADEDVISKVLVAVATLLIIFLLAEEASSRWLSSVWALSGMSLLGCGFYLRDKIFRICALCVFSLACLRVIAYDLAGVDTIYRIIAFIFLGAVLLGASIVYSKLMSRQNPRSQ